MKISIWTGHAFEPWGPSSIDEGGIGGSETAAVHVGFELANLGHEVMMFGEHQGKEERFLPRSVASMPGSVEYVDFRHALAHPDILACDVFVSSRDKTVLRVKPDAKVKVLWIHDIHVGDDWENEVGLFDRVYCLTKWHREFVMEHYPHVEPTQFHLTRNGIDPARFEPNLTWKNLLSRKRPRFVWSSSLDRGLDVMLDLWPEVRKMQPGATLHVYYGIENWRKLNAENKQGLAVVDFMMGRIEGLGSEGVVYHGRVGQAELARAHMDALCWAYPTAWMETSCITALEAQAAGAFPISSKLAALPETVREGILIPGRNKSATYKASFLSALRLVLDGFQRSLSGELPSEVAEQNRAWALEQTWAGVAQLWSDEFEGLLSVK
jgi:glycosyltransferase involved in cell wall biosynthesis